MRTLAVLLLLRLISNTADAQQWCIADATWYYSEEWGGNGYEKYHYVGDTLINELSANVIAFTSSTQTAPTLLVTRAAEGVVYIHQDYPEWSTTFWDTLIWFDAVPGQQWDQLAFVDFECPGQYDVVDTGHVMIEGQSLRFVEAANDEFNDGLPFRFIERIGSMQGLLFLACKAEVGVEPRLRCYSDSELSFETGIVPSCSTIVGLNEAAPGPTWSLQPVGTDRLRLNGLDLVHDPPTVHFIDMQGRCVAVSHMGSDRTVYVGDLIAGSYVLQVVGAPRFPPLRWNKP